MERNEIIKRINNIDLDIARVRESLQDILKTNHSSFPAEYEKLTIEAAMRSEQIACKFRHLIYATLPIRKSELMKKVSEAQGIDINYEDGIFTLTMPSLLPKKRKSMSSEYIFDPVIFALDRFFTVNRIEKFRECVVCFTHVYSEKTPSRRIRDYDNVELKQVLDMVSVFVMTDDSGAFCDAYHTTKYGEKDMTRISVMSKNKFKNWV